jgi:hypothetical protein
VPPCSRSIAHTTVLITAPALRNAAHDASKAPPVATTSSTTTTRLSGYLSAGMHMPRGIGP